MADQATILRQVVTDSGVAVALSGDVSHIQISNDQSIATRLFFTAADMAGGTNYVELAATSGYYEGLDGNSTIYLKLASAGSQTLTIKYNSRKQTTSVS